jgi:P4 family phage/plasmid primase-like protien
MPRLKVAETVGRAGQPQSSPAEVPALTSVPPKGGNGQSSDPDSGVHQITSLDTNRNPDPNYFFGERGRFIVALAAQLIQARGRVCLGTDGRLYRFENGVYRPDGEEFARVQTRKLLGEMWQQSHPKQVVRWLKDFPPRISDLPPNDEINVANGLLDWRSGELRAHSPGFLSTIQLPVAWVPDARCPRIDAFLQEVLPADALDFIFEVIGLAMYPGNPMRKAILLCGSGKNGKSVLLNLIMALLCEENVSSVSLQDLSDNRFRPAELFGKLANICGDLDARAIKQTDIIKQMTGGDAISAERKYGHPFSFKSFALPLFSANEPPMSADQTQAWFDRWIVIPMEHRVRKEDKDLTAKLTTPEELEGLLQRSVEGLRRLMERGHFQYPPSVAAACEKYRQGLDTIGSFLDENCLLNDSGWIRRPALYAAYKNWCGDSGRPRVSPQRFNEEISRRLCGRVNEATRTGMRGWKGIRLQ